MERGLRPVVHGESLNRVGLEAQFLPCWGYGVGEDACPSTFFWLLVWGLPRRVIMTVLPTPSPSIWTVVPEAEVCRCRLEREKRRVPTHVSLLCPIRRGISGIVDSS